MVKITDYGIVSANSSDELIDGVVDCIGKGWQPLGGAIPGVDADGKPLLMQTVIRTGPPNKLPNK